MSSGSYKINKYKNNFLTGVILKIDYPSISNLETTDQLDEFHKKIKKIALNKKEIPRILMEGQVNNDDFQMSKKESRITWEFSNKDESKKIAIDKEFISVVYTKYKNFDNYFKEIKTIIDAFNQSFPFSTAKRIGLRYVNIITIKTGNPFEWDNLINKDLLSVFSNFVDEKVGLLKNMQYLDFKTSEYQMIFWSGLYNSEYPNPISRKEFVLDYDCFIMNEIPFSEFYPKIELFNITINKWFEHSIENNLRRIMEEVDDEKTKE